MNNFIKPSNPKREPSRAVEGAPVQHVSLERSAEEWQRLLDEARRKQDRSEAVAVIGKGGNG